MANTLTAVISADTSGFTKSISEAKSVLQKYTQEAREASNQIKEYSSVTDSQVASFQRVVKALDKVESGTLSTTQVQKALATQLQELKIQWANLSDEAKSSDFGATLSSTLSSVESTLKGLSSQVKQASSEIGSIGGTGKQIPLKAQLKQLQTQLTTLTAQYRAMSDAEKQSASGQELAKKMDELRAKAGVLKDTIGDVSSEIAVMASDTPNLDVFNDVIGISGDALSAYSSILAKVTGDEDSLKDAIATVMAVQSTANLLTKVTNSLQSSSALMLKVRTVQEGAAATAIKLRTMAENKGTIATGAATVAQKIFNAVAKANPYVLLATAVIGVATALYAFSSGTDKATQKEKELQREAEATKKKLEEQKHASEVLGNKTGDLVGSFLVLQSQWKSLKTEADKKEWIKNNQTAFDNLNLSVWNVNDAYNVFVKNAPKVIAALKAIAEAEAYQDLYKDAIKKKATEWDNRKGSTDTGDFYTKETGGGTEIGTTPSMAIKKNDEWVAAGITDSDVVVDRAAGLVNSYYKLNKSGIDKVNKYRNDQAIKTRQRMEKGYQDEVDRYGDLMDAANKKAETAKATLASLGGTGTKPGTTTKHTPSNTSDKPEAVSGSLQDLENKLSDLKKKYKDGILKITPENYQKQVDELEAQIKKKRIEMGLEVEVLDGSLQKLNEDIAKQETLLKLAVDDESRKKIQSTIDELTRQKAVIELKLKPVVEDSDLEDLQESISEHLKETTVRVHQQSISPKGDKVQQATTNANNIKEELTFNEGLLKSYKAQYNAIQDRIKAGATLTSNESQLLSIYDEAKKKVDDLSVAYKNAASYAEQLQTKSDFNKKVYQGFKSTVSSLGSFNDSIKGVSDTWQNLSDNWDDMSTFEQITSGIGGIVDTIDKALSAYEAINETIQLFDAISEASAAKKIASNSAQMASDATLVATQSANTSVKVANDAVENASNLGKIAVDEGTAIASATASGASLPFPANIAAIAAGIAAVVAAFSMISGFATGGIVGGKTTVGDYNLIRANKGEMILSNRQQANLFRLLDSGTSGGSNGNLGIATVRVKGSDLFLALSNYSKSSPNRKF